MGPFFGISYTGNAKISPISSHCHLSEPIDYIYPSILPALNRRIAIRQFAFLAAGAALIPSCMQDKSKSAILLRNIKIDQDQEKLLEELSETLIPKTDTPGARDVAAHLFLLKMVDDCMSPEQQQRFISGLKSFQKLAGQKLTTSFEAADPSRKLAFIKEIHDRNGSDDLAFFYQTSRQYTIQGYASSQFYLTQVQVYELVPSRFHGCVPVNPHSN